MTVKTTPEGFLVLNATLSRTGMYDYSAAEMRRMGVKLADRVPNEAVVRIYRDGAEVFDVEAMKSFELKPVTVMHPSKQVGPKSVSSDLVGVVGSPVVSDGLHTRAQIQIMTDKGIARYKAGLRQLSAGYTATLDMTAGRTRDGQPYDGRQTKIVGNHIAMVPAGRAGTAKLGDIADNEEKKPMAEKDKSTHTVDAVAFGELKQQHADMTVQLDATTKERDKLAGEVEALKGSSVSDEDTQAKIEAGVKDELAARDNRAKTVDKARRLAPAMTVRDTDTDRAIMETAIKAQRPDIVTDGQTDEYVGGMFDMLKPVTPKNITSMRVADGKIPDVNRLRALAR